VVYDRERKCKVEGCDRKTMHYTEICADHRRRKCNNPECGKMIDIKSGNRFCAAHSKTKKQASRFLNCLQFEGA
jgi:hypothetical protein